VRAWQNHFDGALDGIHIGRFPAAKWRLVTRLLVLPRIAWYSLSQVLKMVK